MGKTSITFGAFRILHDKGLVKKVLVIAPLRPCYLVWPKEAQKWAEFQHLRVEILHGKDKEDALARDADIYVINPEGLDWLCGRTIRKAANGGQKMVYTMEKLKQLNPDMLVVDESTKFKHSNTNRFKAMRELVRNMKRRYILTGTPTPNGLMDLFGQIYILDEGSALGRYITHFRTNYFYPSGYGGYEWSPQADAFDRITRRISPLVLRMESKDYLKLPPRVVDTRFVELPQNAMQRYRQLENDLITRIEQEVIVAGNAAAASMKCRQVANGGLYLNDLSEEQGVEKDWIPIHSEKQSALKDLVEEMSGQPLLVLYQFRFDKELIREALGYKVPDMGELTGEKLKVMELAFNSGKVPVLMGHPASMGHGLNLQENCSRVCWFGLTWDLEHYEQATKRIDRQGRRVEVPHVIVYHLLAKDTIDEVIAGVLQGKDRSQNALLAALKGLRSR